MTCVTITTLCELNDAVDRYIQTKFDQYLIQCATPVKIKTIEQYMYRMIFESIDISKINYDVLNIQTIILKVRREMLNFVDQVYQLHGDERELGKVEEYLTGYYIQAYLLSQL